MKYLQTMVRDSEQGRFTLVFPAAEGDDQAQIELTYSWDTEVFGEGHSFGHIPYQVCILPITFRSNFCREAHRSHLRNLGSECPIPTSGHGINN